MNTQQARRTFGSGRARRELTVLAALALVVAPVACGKEAGSADADMGGAKGSGGSRATGGDKGSPGGESNTGGKADTGGRSNGGRATGGQSGEGLGGMGGEVAEPGELRLKLIGESEVVLDCGVTYEDRGVLVISPVAPEVDVEVVSGLPLSTEEPGTFKVKYEAIDPAGKTATIARTVQVCGPSCGDLGKQPISLAEWTTVQYELNYQSDARWELSEDGYSVVQTVNADAGMLISDFDATDLAVEGTWVPGSSSDDDFVGFVFGYQDRGHYYLLDWKQGSQDHRGYAEQGMTLKIVSMPTQEGELVEPTGYDLWPTEGSENVAIIEVEGEPLHNQIPWEEAETYTFFLEFHAGSFKIEIYDSAAELLESWSVSDSTYTGGRFGFYNYSQAPVDYQGFVSRKTPLACSTVGK